MRAQAPPKKVETVAFTFQRVERGHNFVLARLEVVSFALSSEASVRSTVNDQSTNKDLQITS